MNHNNYNNKNNQISKSKNNIIFWPNDIKLNNASERYLILGYRIDQFTVVVIDIIVKEDYREISNKTDKDIFRNIEILTSINCKIRKCHQHSHNHLYEVQYDFVKNQPILNNNQTIIFFKPPNSSNLEYFSLDPIKINIFWNNNNQIGELIFRRPSTRKYADKLLKHFSNFDNDDDDNLSLIGENSREILRIINLTNYIRVRINANRLNRGNIFNIFNCFIPYYEVMFTLVAMFYYIFIQKTCYLLSSILTYPVLKLNFKYKVSNDGKSTDKNKTNISLSSLSFMIHQINFRAKQLYNLPLQFKKLRYSKLESEASIIKDAKFSPSEYIKFYNTVWLIMNDLLLGVVFTTILKNHHHTILRVFEKIVVEYHVLLSNTITWLMNSPAGFKLNNELASFMGQLILWVLDFWKQNILKFLISNSDNILITIEIFSQYFGLSIGISMILDLFNIFILSINGFYIASTRIYCWQLNILRSLFKLFYGKKYNVLRNRVDSKDYEFDQLMLGIIIFTILIYLLPTVFIFYLTFIIARLTILILNFTLKLLLISLNHLPIVAFLLKLKNQDRLPGGIVLDCEFYTNDYRITLHSKSLSIGEIVTSHINSMLNFNKFNLNAQDTKSFVENLRADKINELYTIDDVVNNWDRISIVTIVKNVVIGEIIKDYDYKEMF